MNHYFSPKFPGTPFIIIVLLFPFCTLLQAQNAGLLPKSKKNQLDVIHISLDLDFDWVAQKAYGEAAISLKLLQTGASVALDAVQMNIKSVTLKNGQSLPFLYDGKRLDDGLNIQLDRKYGADETIEFLIRYETQWVNHSDPANLWGSFGKGLRFLGPTSADPRKRRQLWSMGEPESNRFWFPCNDAPADLRSWELRATVDPNMTVISNGQLLGNKLNPDGRRHFHWKTEKAFPNHLSALVIGEYVETVSNAGSVPGISYAYPDEVEATQASAVRLPDMLQYYATYLEMPYPLGEYRRVHYKLSGIGIKR